MVRKGYERVMCERWVADWIKTATYWPPALLAIAALLSHPAELFNRGPWGPSSLLGLVLTASNCDNWRQTLISTWLTSCRTGLYNCFASICFRERFICTQLNPSTVKGILWYLRPHAPVIYISAFLIRQLGPVGGQYVTKGLVTATRNDTDKTMANRMANTRKPRWEEKQLFGCFQRLINNIPQNDRFVSVSPSFSLAQSSCYFQPVFLPRPVYLWW